MQYTLKLIVPTVTICFISLGCNQAHFSNETVNHGDKIQVAGIVLKWIMANKEQNYQRAEPLIREAAAKGAELVITTECFLDGYAIRDKSMPIEAWRALGEEIPGGEYVGRLQRLADELNIYLIASMVERAELATYNVAILIDPNGKLIGKYRKQHLGHEAVRNSAGSANPVFNTSLGKIGIMICADRRYPEVARQLRQNGAELIVCPSGGMWGSKDNDHFLQARSAENGIPIVFVHPIEFLVTGPDGSILDRHFVGDRMSIKVNQIDTQKDEKMIVLYELKLR
ncbi:MAG: carbon-nitrogen hydrolase family protein [Planctomycetota bacterium]|nr:MAG: carbon-nitrogen hydrolase family protein [Planctomycetota bacterium]